MKSKDFAYYLSKYFRSYMPGILGLRDKTIQTYQTAFFVFIRFMKDEKNIIPNKISLEMLNIDLIMEFLQYLELMGNSISTRNHRLSVLRSFFKYIQLVEPKYLIDMQQLLSIRRKKQLKPVVNFLQPEAIKLLTSAPIATTKHGYRDMLLLSTLYETGARVSELTSIILGNIRLENPATILLHGKGGKSRIVPISKELASLITNYLTKENLLSSNFKSDFLFKNRSNIMLTNAGVTHILLKYVKPAREQYPTLFPDKISPHCMRHSRAMHLLQSGVDLIYIRDFLGHESLKTTEIYISANRVQTRKVIEAAYVDLPDDKAFAKDWNTDQALMQWINELCN